MPSWWRGALQPALTSHAVSAQLYARDAVHGQAIRSTRLMAPVFFFQLFFKTRHLFLRA